MNSLHFLLFIFDLYSVLSAINNNLTNSTVKEAKPEFEYFLEKFI